MGMVLREKDGKQEMKTCHFKSFHGSIRPSDFSSEYADYLGKHQKDGSKQTSAEV